MVSLLLVWLVSGCALLGIGALKVGDKGKVTTPGGDKAFVCSDINDYDPVAETLSHKRDEQTMKDLAADGKVFVPNGTRVKVLIRNRQPAASRVEFLDRPNKEQTAGCTSWMAKP